ncbi:MAG: hypothetical protein AAB360_01550 [Patescibacteria group bacterium]
MVKKSAWGSYGVRLLWYDGCMAQASRIFLNGSLYHIYNRGVEKRTVFLDDADFRHFLLTLSFYQQLNSAGKLSKSGYALVDRAPELKFNVVAYCLMPNHFHLILKQLAEGGVRRGLSDILNSYTRYFNMKYGRVGPLFQGTFKSVCILTDEQFVHVLRYVLLNPFAGGLVKDFGQYRWSSFREYLDNSGLICNFDEINSRFSTKESFKTFVGNYADYARQLDLIKHDVLE